MPYFTFEHLIPFLDLRVLTQDLMKLIYYSVSTNAGTSTFVPNALGEIPQTHVERDLHSIHCLEMHLEIEAATMPASKRKSAQTILLTASHYCVKVGERNEFPYFDSSGLE